MCQLLRCCLFLISLFTTCIVTAQVSVGSSNYTTLKAAFDAINAGTHTGHITINISGNTIETAAAVINDSGTGPSSYRAIAINATTTATITSNIASATIIFNGADSVNFNGNNTLQIINTHSTGSVFSFVSDASDNTIRNTSIIGNTANFANSVIGAGVINFGQGINTGNNRNIIDNCSIDGNNQAICLVYSKGLTTSATTTNYRNTIKNSRLFNYVNTTIAAAVAVSLSGSDQWTIQNNSIYITASVNTAQQYIIRGILITPDFTSDFHTVTGNYFGGNSASAAGTMTLNGTGTNAVGLIGIDVETGGTGNMVSNNVVKNISLTYNSVGGSYSNAGIFGFIGNYSGTSTFTGNEVSNLSIVNNGGFTNFSAMQVNGRVTTATTVTPTFNITNNIINIVSANSGIDAGGVNIHGIRLDVSSGGSLSNNSIAKTTFNVTGNTVSNINVPFAGSAGTFIRGIGTITTQGTSSTASLYPNVNITGNMLHSFSTASTLANYGNGAVTGIHCGGASTVGNPDMQVISQNTVYNLAATNTGNVGTVVIGILASTGLHDINRNKIFDLRNAATATGATAPGIVGLTVRRATGTSTTANNFISLGTGVSQDVQIFGLLQNFNDGGPVNVYHNSIYIGGTAGSGDKRSAAIIRGTELFGTGITTPLNLKNNILYNARSGGSGSHYAVVNSEAAPAAGFTSTSNVLYTVNPSTIAMWGSTNNDLATYKTNSGDVYSKTITVNFSGVATGDLHLTGTSIGDNNLSAAPVGVTFDYDGTTRSTTPVYIGADEASVALPIVLRTFVGYKEGSNNKLVWTTSSETNNKEFELQRSADGRTFSSIATIASKAVTGNSNNAVTYSFTDESPLPGISYYRLRQIDNDGRSSFISVIVTIKRDIKGFEITSVYPNPAKDILYLNVNSAIVHSASITIADASGKALKQLSRRLLAGVNNVQVDVSNLPSGAYLLTITNQLKATQTVTIIKN